MFLRPVLHDHIATRSHTSRWTFEKHFQDCNVSPSLEMVKIEGKEKFGKLLTLEALFLKLNLVYVITLRMDATSENISLKFEYDYYTQKSCDKVYICIDYHNDLPSNNIIIKQIKLIQTHYNKYRLKNSLVLSLLVFRSNVLKWCGNVVGVGRA